MLPRRIFSSIIKRNGSFSMNIQCICTCRNNKIKKTGTQFSQYRSFVTENRCLLRTLVHNARTQRRQGTAHFSTDADDRSSLEISYEQLASELAKGSVQVIDVRQPEELEQDGCIPSAINIPLAELPDALNASPSKFKALYGYDAPDFDGDHIVFSCRSGHRSLRALQIAHENGYVSTRHFPGGFMEWQARKNSEK